MRIDGIEEKMNYIIKQIFDEDNRFTNDELNNMMSFGDIMYDNFSFRLPEL